MLAVNAENFPRGGHRNIQLGVFSSSTKRMIGLWIEGSHLRTVLIATQGTILFPYSWCATAPPLYIRFNV